MFERTIDAVAQPLKSSDTSQTIAIRAKIRIVYTNEFVRSIHYQAQMDSTRQPGQPLSKLRARIGTQLCVFTSRSGGLLGSIGDRHSEPYALVTAKGVQFVARDEVDGVPHVLYTQTLTANELEQSIESPPQAQLAAA